ncbi:hypothetical protein Pelo_10309 [Pelomyxa schiedti]|nr:hypothetical protein Pelo_10309 [Pelomyxa schiedti]
MTSPSSSPTPRPTSSATTASSHNAVLINPSSPSVLQQPSSSSLASFSPSSMCVGAGLNGSTLNSTVNSAVSGGSNIANNSNSGLNWTNYSNSRPPSSPPSSGNDCPPTSSKSAVKVNVKHNAQPQTSHHNVVVVSPHFLPNQTPPSTAPVAALSPSSSPILVTPMYSATKPTASLMSPVLCKTAQGTKSSAQSPTQVPGQIVDNSILGQQVFPQSNPQAENILRARILQMEYRAQTAAAKENPSILSQAFPFIQGQLQPPAQMLAQLTQMPPPQVPQSPPHPTRQSQPPTQSPQPILNDGLCNSSFSDTLPSKCQSPTSESTECSCIFCPKAEAGAATGLTHFIPVINGKACGEAPIVLGKERIHPDSTWICLQHWKENKEKLQDMEAKSKGWLSFFETTLPALNLEASPSHSRDKDVPMLPFPADTFAERQRQQFRLAASALPSCVSLNPAILACASGIQDFTPLTLDQLSPEFIRFLAWQRLMQINQKLQMAHPSKAVQHLQVQSTKHSTYIKHTSTTTSKTESAHTITVDEQHSDHEANSKRKRSPPHVIHQDEGTEEPKKKRNKNRTADTKKNMVTPIETEPVSAPQAQGIPPPAPPPLERLPYPYFVTPEGKILAGFTKQKIEIGRIGKGVVPDLNLEWSGVKSISHLHAVITVVKENEAAEETYWLEHKGRNSTKVNGTMVKAGDSAIQLTSGVLLDCCKVLMYFMVPPGSKVGGLCQLQPQPPTQSTEPAQQQQEMMQPESTDTTQHKRKWPQTSPSDVH